MRLAGGVLSSCSRNGSMLVSKKRNMGFGPLGIAAGSRIRKRWQVRRRVKGGPTAKREKRDLLVEAAFAAQTSGRRVRRRSPAIPAARKGVTHRRGRAGREAAEPENASNRNHSGLLGSRPTSFRGPKIRARHRSHTRVDGRNHLEFVIPARSRASVARQRQSLQRQFASAGAGNIES